MYRELSTNARRVIPFAAAAMLALALVHPSASGVAHGEDLLAAGLALFATVAAFGLPWRRLGRWLPTVPALMYLLVVALLRDAAGGSASGLSPLVVLPVFWLALYGTRLQLLVTTAGVGAVFFVPPLVVGSGAYAGSWRAGMLFMAVCGFIGFTVQRLVRRVSQQARSAESARRDLALTLEVSREVAASADVRMSFCRAAREVSGATFACLFEPDGEQRLAASAMSGMALQGPRVPLTSEQCASVLARCAREPLFLPDARDHSALDERVSEAAGSPASMLFQPVLRGEQGVALLALGWQQRLESIDAHATLIGLLAAEAAVAFERADLVARLREHASSDPLTGLANRRCWDKELARALSGSAPVTVAVLDLDDFKALNDRDGHAAGDRLLKEAGAAWREQLRDRDLLARLGGDEFAVLLPNCSLTEATEILERLREATPGDKRCSGGVAEWDRRESPASLLARVDRAMYRTKRSARGQRGRRTKGC